MRLDDPIKTKQLRKALEDLAEEGVIRRCSSRQIGADWIVGVVGQLQLDVLATRMAAEYRPEARLRGLALGDCALGRAPTTPRS